ncbi:paraquat-inducible protein A [Myxococcota bacterium]|nr:paraquat-inducible protein A [Myxococcota bacterium]
MKIDHSVVRCTSCDGWQQLPPVPPSHRARCYRCRALLQRSKHPSLDVPLALSLAALIALAIANGTPFLSLEYAGIRQSNFLVTGAMALWQDDHFFLSLLVAFTGILAPATQISLVCYLLLSIRRGRLPWKFGRTLRLVTALGPWSMAGVYLIGVFVASAKLGQFAALVEGTGFYAFVAMVLLWTASSATLDPRALGRRPELNAGGAP